MADVDLDILISSIYEASVIPERWPEVLDRLAQATSAQGGVLFTVNWEQDIRWIASEPLTDFVQEFVANGWAAKNTRGIRLMKKLRLGGNQRQTVSDSRGDKGFDDSLGGHAREGTVDRKSQLFPERLKAFDHSRLMSMSLVQRAGFQVLVYSKIEK